MFVITRHILENPSTISDLYRFALVLTQSIPQAMSLVEESIQEILQRRSEESTRRMRWLIFQKIRQKALRQTPQKSEEVLPDVVTALHGLPEPSRTAMTLLCLDSFSLQDLESFLDLSTRELGEALELARSNLKPVLSSPQTKFQ